MNTIFFLLSGQMTEYKMRSDSNYDLLETFQNITIGDDDKPSYLG